MNNRKNLISALVAQFIHILYGLIVPRIILGAFGSNINGLVSSINQFLSFITLLEGGLGAVVLAELYFPIEKKDSRRIRGIMLSCQRFFSRLTIIFALYTLALAIVYAFAVKNEYDFFFVFSLVLVLSLITVSQYLFSINYKLYLQADQRLYIVNNISSIMLLVNIVITFVVVKVFPEIRVLKIASSMAFFVQPIILRKYVDKDYRNFRVDSEIVKLTKQRSGFAQNLAFFINMNTDIALITIFATLSDVSIYSVYLIAITAIRSVISSLTNSYQSAIGKYIVQGNEEELKKRFDDFCKWTWIVTTILFCTCLLLINQFVNLYTRNVEDANYYQPLFALVMTVSNIVYCIREPYRLLVLSAGKFKETNFGSFMEAIINIVLSIILIKPLGLLGVAIGTLAAITYRFIYFIWYLRKDIIHSKISYYVVDYFRLFIILSINVIAYFLVPLEINTVVSFIFFGFVIVVIESILSMFIFYGPKGSLIKIKELMKHIFKSKQEGIQ